MDIYNQFIGLVAALLATCLSVQGVITLQGCTEAFISLQCPDDDLLSVYDIRYSKEDQGHKCTQQVPAAKVRVPTELYDSCVNGTNQFGGHICTYVEDICEGLNQCTFYASPHLLNRDERPGINSEIIIKYECRAGSKRKGEIGLVALVAAVSILSLFLIGGLLIYRILTQDPSTYADFTNDRPRPAPRTTTTPTTTAPVVSPSASGGYGSSQEAAAAAKTSVSNFEEISVELRSPSSVAAGNTTA